MRPVVPRIVNDVSCVTGINDESLFAWQAQYLVKFKCHFSWQAQYLVKFGKIGGAQCCIFQYKMLLASAKSKPRLHGALRTDGFMLGSAGHCK